MPERRRLQKSKVKRFVLCMVWTITFILPFFVLFMGVIAVTKRSASPLFSPLQRDVERVHRISHKRVGSPEH